MKYRNRFAVKSWVAVAGIVDSLALVAAVFAGIVNVYGNHPVLSAWAVICALAMFVVLATIVSVAER
jgi:hypothetical protein